MPNTYKNKVVYNGTTLIDLTADTVTASTLMQGYTAHDKSGALITGTASGGSPTLQAKTYTVDSAGTATVTADSGYDGLSSVSVSVPSASPFMGSSGETFVTEGGYRRWKANVFTEVNASEGDAEGWLPDGYHQDFTFVKTAVPSNTIITPTTSAQTVGGVNYMMEGPVTVAAMPSGTAGTPTATKGSVSNHAVSVTPSVTNQTGYITGGTKTGTAVSVSASELVSGTLSITSSGTKDVTNYASASVAAGGATASATKGTVSNHSVTVTPSVTRTAGYVTAGTANGTAVTVSASELVSGSETKTENGTYDVTNLASLIVNVDGGSSSYTRTVIVPQQTVTPNSDRLAYVTSTDGYAEGEMYIVTLDGTEYATRCTNLWTENYSIGSVGWYFGANNDVVYPFGSIYAPLESGEVSFAFSNTSSHTVKVEKVEFIDGPLNLIAKSITSNGTYTASSDNADGYSSVTVNVPSDGGTMQTKTVTPTTSQQTVQPDSGYDGLSQVTVNAIPSQYIVPSGNKSITANGTNIDVSEYATVSVSVSGSSKNVQTAQSTTRVANTAYTKTASLTCTVSGTYDVYWDCFRSTTSGTSGSQLYIGGTASGSANTTFSNHAQNNHRTGVHINANQEVAVYVRSRATNYYAYCGQLTIVQTA